MAPRDSLTIQSDDNEIDVRGIVVFIGEARFKIETDDDEHYYINLGPDQHDFELGDEIDVEGTLHEDGETIVDITELDFHDGGDGEDEDESEDDEDESEDDEDEDEDDEDEDEDDDDSESEPEEVDLRGVVIHIEDGLIKIETRDDGHFFIEVNAQEYDLQIGDHIEAEGLLSEDSTTMVEVFEFEVDEEDDGPEEIEVTGTVIRVEELRFKIETDGGHHLFVQKRPADAGVEEGDVVEVEGVLSRDETTIINVRHIEVVGEDDDYEEIEIEITAEVIEATRDFLIVVTEDGGEYKVLLDQYIGRDIFLAGDIIEVEGELIEREGIDHIRPRDIDIEERSEDEDDDGERDNEVVIAGTVTEVDGDDIFIQDEAGETYKVKLHTEDHLFAEGDIIEVEGRLKVKEDENILNPDYITVIQGAEESRPWGDEGDEFTEIGGVVDRVLGDELVIITAEGDHIIVDLETHRHSFAEGDVIVVEGELKEARDDRPAKIEARFIEVLEGEGETGYYGDHDDNDDDRGFDEDEHPENEVLEGTVLTVLGRYVILDVAGEDEPVLVKMDGRHDLDIGDTVALFGEFDDDGVFEVDEHEVERVDPDARDDAEFEGDGDDDQIGGSRDDDVLRGRNGNDELYGNDGDDDIDCGKGSDDASGGDGDDRIAGGKGDDIIRGEGGDDDLDGGKGNDDLDGQGGRDSIDGGKGKDDIDGGNADDDLDGGEGKDRIDGGDGDDDICGGEGKDTLFGGEGADNFLFDETCLDGSKDKIKDFDINEDELFIHAGAEDGMQVSFGNGKAEIEFEDGSRILLKGDGLDEDSLDGVITFTDDFSGFMA